MRPGVWPFDEVEPNDEIEQAIPIEPVSPDGLCIKGTIDCGNDQGAYTEPGDWFFFMAPASGTFEGLLSWPTLGDMDFYLYDAQGTELITFMEVDATSEAGSAQIAGGEVYWIYVICWSGAGGDYALTATW